MTNNILEQRLIKRLQNLSNDDAGFWSFVGRTRRNYTHNFFQYPAMMVPQMQEVLLDTFLSTIPEINHAFDPFSGSGTVMTEAMHHGLNFTAQDINPLAILLCMTKSGPMDIELIHEKWCLIQEDIAKDTHERIDVNFPNINKWFRQDIAQDLSKIRRAILEISEQWIRRFFWVALAETVRLTSNSRTSNFKLYTLPLETIANRQISTMSIFFELVERNLRQFHEHRTALSKRNLVIDNNYKGIVEVILGDSSVMNHNTQPVSELMITSPPYGDNSTTVSYGQYSYLPLRWIALSDIGADVDEQYLSSTHEIDRRSLGGSRANAVTRAEQLFDMSPSFKKTIEGLSNLKSDRIQRVASFCSDLDKTIDPILAKLKPNAYMVWVVGNREVGKKQVPMNRILQELLETRNVELLIELDRFFPSNTKRMANLTNTMPSEHILVMKRVNSN